eukprot:1236347-Amphidinium_carterae.2
MMWKQTVDVEANVFCPVERNQIMMLLSNWNGSTCHLSRMATIACKPNRSALKLDIPSIKS